MFSMGFMILDCPVLRLFSCLFLPLVDLFRFLVSSLTFLRETDLADDVMLVLAVFFGFRFLSVLPTVLRDEIAFLDDFDSPFLDEVDDS